MEMKVCKLVRLTKKNSEGTEFVKDKEGQIEVRKRVVVPQETVEEYEGNYKTSGLLYIVNESKTAARNTEVENEVEQFRAAEERRNNPQSVAPAPVVPVTPAPAPIDEKGAKENDLKNAAANVDVKGKNADNSGEKDTKL